MPPVRSTGGGCMTSQVTTAACYSHALDSSSAIWISRSRRASARWRMMPRNRHADPDGDDDDRGERIDVRRHAQLHLAPDQERQCGGARAAGEAGDDDVIERDGESEKPAGDECGRNHRQRHVRQHAATAWRRGPSRPPRSRCPSRTGATARSPPHRSWRR